VSCCYYSALVCGLWWSLIRYMSSFCLCVLVCLSLYIMDTYILTSIHKYIYIYIDIYILIAYVQRLSLLINYVSPSPPLSLFYLAPHIY
jgi:hypothetical protein